jgi:hypothetical protein
MKSLALLLSFAMPAALAAQETQVTPKQDKVGWYRTVREFHEAGVVARRSFPFETPTDAKGNFMYCALPPAADWVLDSREETIEEQYLKLLQSAINLHVRQTPNREIGTGVIGFCGKIESPTPQVDLDRLDADWRKICQQLKPALQPGRYTCTEGSGAGGTPFPPKTAVIETLKALARSPHAKTATTALGLMDEIKGREKFFARTVREVLRDPKTPLAARERAAEILASVHTHDLSGHTLAAIWGDKSNPESLRRAALRGYSLIMSFGTSRMAGSDPQAKGAVRDRLHQYLHPLAGVIQAETRDGKDGKGGKDTLTPLGEDALCVAEQYSKQWICYANRYGTKWYEEVRKDEAAGVDVCAKDGKLKR